MIHPRQCVSARANVFGICMLAATTALPMRAFGLADEQLEVAQETIDGQRFGARGGAVLDRLADGEITDTSAASFTIQRTSSDFYGIDLAQVAQDPVPVAQVRKISDEQAAEIASGVVKGAVMDVQLERKMGEKRIVVEVIRETDGAEIDVVIDRMTGEVLDIDD